MFLAVQEMETPKLGVMTDACNYSTEAEAEAGELL